MKQALFIILLFAFYNPLWAAISFKEKNSLALIEKLSQDSLSHLALLEVEYFLANFPSSSKKKEVKLQQATLLTKITDYQASIQILSGLKITEFQKETYEDLVFLQAKNYLFTHDFTQSLIFFQNIAREKQDLYYSNAFYQGIAYLFLGELLLAKQAINNISKINQTKREQQILATINKWSPPENITTILANKNFSQLEKLILTTLFFELELQQKNTKQALEKLFFFNLQNKKSDGIFAIVDFLVGKALYKLAQAQHLEHKILQEAKQFLVSYQEKHNSPTHQSYFYLGNIYAELGEYDLAYRQYNNLLQYVEYTKLTDFILNYVKLSRFLQKTSLVPEILQKATNNTTELNTKKKFITTLIDFYTAQKVCNKAESYLLEVASITNSIKNFEGNFILGKCYFEQNEQLKSLHYLEKIPLDYSNAAKITKMIAIILGKQKNKEKFLAYFAPTKDPATKKHQAIQINTLQYYYYAKDWQEFIKNFQALEKTNFFLADFDTKKQLATAYTQNNQQSKATAIYLALLKNNLAPKDTSAIVKKLIQIYQKQKSYAKISEVYKILLEDLAEANKPKTELLIAKNYLAAKKTVLAQKWFRRIAYRKNTATILNYTELQAEAFYYLAGIYSAQKKYKSAITILIPELKRISIKNKWYSRLNFTIAQAYANLQQWKNALKHYKKVTNKKNSKESRIAKGNIKKIQSFLTKQKQNNQ